MLTSIHLSPPSLCSSLLRNNLPWCLEKESTHWSPMALLTGLASITVLRASFASFSDSSIRLWMSEWMWVALVAFRDTNLTFPRPLWNQHIYRCYDKLKLDFPIILKSLLAFFPIRAVPSTRNNSLWIPFWLKKNLKKQWPHCHNNTKNDCLVNTQRRDDGCFSSFNHSSVSPSCPLVISLQTPACVWDATECLHLL